MNPKRFFAELKRRRVYKVAVAYGIVSWLLLQIATQVFPFFEIPNWAVRLVVVLIILGFPIALVLAWAYDLTPEGIKRTEDVDLAPSVRRSTGRRLDFFMIAMLLVVIAVLAYQHFYARPPAQAAPLEKSIAVLPFENFSDEKETTFFADGVQDDILTNLAKVADLKVISRTSVMSYRSENNRNLAQIARELNVGYVVEGSVRRADGKVRVSAQLVDARNGTQLWAEAYNRDLADVFAIQSEIAQTVVTQLRAKLSPQEKAAIDEQPTKDLFAYDLYVRAKALRAAITFDPRVKENLLEATRLLDQAVARDPAFFLAWCQLAEAHDLIYFLGTDHTPARLALADAAIKRALRLRPDSGEAHLVLAQHLYRGYLDYEHAIPELTQAQRALPNDPLVFELTGFIERRQGHWEESTMNLKRAFELDPRNLFLLQQLSQTYQTQRRYQDMAAVLDRALTLAPSDANTRLVRASIYLEERADTKPLHATIDAIVAEDPAAARDLAWNWLHLALCERASSGTARALAAIPSDGISEGNTWFPRAWCEALAARARGDANAARAAFTTARTEVEKIMREQPDYPEGLTVLGMIDAGLGRKEEAIREGRRAAELLPVSKDALDGSEMLQNLALIYAWTGEKDLALKQLAAATQIPSKLSYGQLRLHPSWDPLRGDPRFDKIVASLAPKSGDGLALLGLGASIWSPRKFARLAQW